MIDQRLFMYVEQELKRGVPDIAIKKALRETGWSEDLVRQAFAIVQSRAEPPRPEIELSEEQMRVRVGRIKRPEKQGKKIPLITILAITLVSVVLVGGWYYSFVYPQQKEAAGIKRILNEQNDPGQTNPSGQPNSDEDITSVVPVGTPVDTGATSTQDQSSSIGLSESGPGAPTIDDPAAKRDGQRRAQLDQLAVAQRLWFTEYGKYYTCGLATGDCGGKAYGFPDEVGVYLVKTAQDPLSGDYGGKKAACGTDYVYCGLNNAPYSEFYCYYARLESGGYYVVSHAGNAKRSTVPKVFEDCAVSN